MTTKHNEDAVSPVIGVVLMVAVTIVLAAVIAAFVFGMVGDIKNGKIVAVTATHPTADTIRVTNNGGQSVDALSSISIVGDNLTASPVSVGTTVGSSATAKLNSTSGGYGPTGTNPFVVIGTFNDGTKQVLYSGTI